VAVATQQVRVGLAQFNPVVGDIAGNSRRILEMYAAANDAGCDIVAFPELSITGYPPEDLVLKSGFVAENQQAMREIVAETQGCVAVFGSVDGTLGSLSNSAAIASNGTLHGTYNKQLLPNYSVFDEERYFAPGSSFSLFTICGVPVGVTICEDIWQADGPVQKQAKAGATLNININGSPYHRGKFDERQRMVSDRARTNSCAIVYVNQVCGQDELVFDGGSMVFDHRGDMLMRAEQFSESLSFIDISVSESHVFGALVLGTRDYVRKNGFTDVVIGLSGGIDSALVAAIAVEALGPQHVHGVSMPSRYSSEGSRTDAALLASNLGIDMQTISIEPAFAAYLDMTAESFAGKAADLTEENLQSRVRGTTLMALSNKFGWMVLTTGNKSELAVGYFTLYGDSVGGYAVIKDLLKTTVYELCRFVNVRAGKEVIPEAVITKPPSAELRPDQRDDQSLPPYEVLDPILELYVEQDRTASEIIALGFDEALVRRISRLVDVNEYKRRQGPPGVRVSLKAFGKDRRLPITNAYRG